MRYEQDRRRPAERLQVLHALDPNQSFDVLARRPPEQRVVQEAAAPGGEVRARQAFALGSGHPWKALGEVDARHLASLGDQPECEGAERIAERGQRPSRQQA
jgi:hypothetical protein